MEDPLKDDAEEAIIREEIKASDEAVSFMSSVGEWVPLRIFYSLELQPTESEPRLVLTHP